MYTPSHYAEARTPVLHELMRAYPLATLVTSSAGGLEANHLPLLLDAQSGESGVLLGHVARANPVWKETAADSEALAIFRGPDHYISPGWYPSKRVHGKVVPTWNYTAIHVRGRVIWHDDSAWLRTFLERLTAEHERTRALRWTLGDAPPDYIERMLTAVVGLEMPIARLTGKRKLSQNQTPADRAGLAAALRRQSGDDALQIAAAVAPAPDAAS